MVEQTEAFKKAVVDSKKLTSKPSNDHLLEMYALYKIGTGEDIKAAPAPGMFDIKGKAKAKAWQGKVDEGVTPELAQEQYVALIDKCKAEYGYDENKAPEAVGSS
ncbi:acyl CoA binding protein [Apiospora rasikravindrae]|uniref:Acyl CoA binding protein n=1 Tax=Apiospora rasikravindrae TaxID=990691 RepID=A0ABR1TXS8_9PEZI